MGIGARTRTLSALLLGAAFIALAMGPLGARAWADGPEADATVSISIEGEVGYHFDVPSDVMVAINGESSEDLIPFEADNAVWKDGIEPPDATGVSMASAVSYSYPYAGGGTVDFHVRISNASTSIVSFKVNGIDYADRCPSGDSEFLETVRDGNWCSFSVEGIPYAENYVIEIAGERNDLMGGFGWNYLDESHPEAIPHGRLTFVQGEYEGIVYDSVSAWNAAKYHGAGEVFAWIDGDKDWTDESQAWGRAAFPKGAKITMKLIPDEGYQLKELYGGAFDAEDEPGVYTITMEGGLNIHLGAKFESEGDVVQANAQAVSEGSIEGAANTYGEGTMRLDVDDLEPDGDTRQAFEDEAAISDKEIVEYLDIHLANVIYKASDDPADAWERPVSELDEVATVKLVLADGLASDDIAIIHDHEGVIETIPAAYDSETGSVSFETDSFSSYAIAATAGPHAIEVTTDGHGIADGPSSAQAGEAGILIELTPAEGYVFDSVSAEGIEEGEDGASYSLLYSGWPDMGILINEMPDCDISFDVRFAEAVSIALDANGGSTGELWQDELLIKRGDSRSFDTSEELVMPPEGMEFDGVMVDGVRYAPGEEIVFDEDATIVFLWKHDEDGGDEGDGDGPICVVRFDANGGAKGADWVGSMELPAGEGETIVVPASLDEIGSDFVRPPAGMVYAGLIANGIFYGPGQEIPLEGLENLTVSFAWKRSGAPSGSSDTGRPGAGTRTPSTGDALGGTAALASACIFAGAVVMAAERKLRRS